MYVDLNEEKLVGYFAGCVFAENIACEIVIGKLWV